MSKFIKSRVWLGLILVGSVSASNNHALKVEVKVESGHLEGVAEEGTIRAFKGIPYAAAPVGDKRWKEPQPPVKWTGVRQASAFGSRCMQGSVFSDMIFRDPGASEDCLYLNVWAPAGAKSPLPVMVWIYGGGFAAGAASEPRQDGGQLTKKGVVVVSFNYRLGIFGFFSHPELTKESSHKASGNYGLLDQVAALRWVQKNIAAFGGDPGNVTIFGESAGSFSVSALMASPLAQGLFQRAIGESGAYFGSTGLPMRARKDTEAADVKFAESIGALTIPELRAKSAPDLLEAASKEKNTVRFAPNVDGYFLPEDAAAIFASGKQSRVPLLAGWNAQESSFSVVFAKEQPTVESFTARAAQLYGDKAGAFLKVYPAATDAEAVQSSIDFASDSFIAYSTWKWLDAQTLTGRSPVYRYRFDLAPPPPENTPPDSPVARLGAVHAVEIEYVFETLPSKKAPWRDEDRKLSDLMATYWTNFAKTGNPNGSGLPEWPRYEFTSGYRVMHLSAEPHAAIDTQRARYEFLDKNGVK
jgi:para-nitrobenzyl esterase